MFNTYTHSSHFESFRKSFRKSTPYEYVNQTRPLLHQFGIAEEGCILFANNDPEKFHR
jgi:hypothetical protein